MSHRFPPLSPQRATPHRSVAGAAPAPRAEFPINLPALELSLLAALALFLALS